MSCFTHFPATSTPAPFPLITQPGVDRPKKEHRRRHILCLLPIAVFNNISLNLIIVSSPETHLYGIVKDLGGRVKHQVLQRCNLWLLPTAQAPVVVHLHHVVGKVLAEAHLVRLWLGL